MKQVTALFCHGEAARAGLDALVQASFPSDAISVLMKEHNEVTPIEVEQKTGMPVAMTAGGAIGAVLGLTAITAFPGLLAAGPALAALTGAFRRRLSRTRLVEDRRGHSRARDRRGSGARRRRGAG